MAVREYVETDGVSKGHQELGAQLRIFIALKYCMFTVEKNSLKKSENEGYSGVLMKTLH